MSKISTLVQARKACSKKALEGLIIPSHLDYATAKLQALENACIDVFDSPQIKKIVNARTYLAFEEKFKTYQDELTKNKELWLVPCEEKAGLQLASCISKIWPKITDRVFEKWAKREENKDFKNQKALFLMRAQNNETRIKRAIASEASAD